MRAGSDVDVDGDRDYRGVPVIGAWTWLPEYGFGVVTKVDRAEAFRPLAILQTAFWGLLTLLAAAAIGVFVVHRPGGATASGGCERRTQDVKRLGRYTLDGKIGEGGMGVIYRARHRDAPPSDRRQAALGPRRPTRSPSRGSSAKSSSPAS